MRAVMSWEMSWLLSVILTRILRCRQRGHFVGDCGQAKSKPCKRLKGGICQRYALSCCVLFRLALSDSDVLLLAAVILVIARIRIRPRMRVATDATAAATTARLARKRVNLCALAARPRFFCCACISGCVDGQRCVFLSLCSIEAARRDRARPGPVSGCIPFGNLPVLRPLVANCR